MSTTHYLSEREKYKIILQLSKDQIRAIEDNDMVAFQEILAKKGGVITSLKDAHSVITVDPTVTTVVHQIQNSERFAERLLYRMLGRLRREIHADATLQNRSAFSCAASVPDPLACHGLPV